MNTTRRNRTTTRKARKKKQTTKRQRMECERCRMQSCGGGQPVFGCGCGYVVAHGASSSRLPAKQVFIPALGPADELEPVDEYQTSSSDADASGTDTSSMPPLMDASQCRSQTRSAPALLQHEVARMLDEHYWAHRYMRRWKLRIPK